MRLEDWLTRLNPRAAVRAVRTIENGIDTLVQFPLRNAIDADGYRHHVVRFGKRGYVVRYTVDDEEVRIHRSWHALEDRR